jgi:glycosyltransferase involved in cell wall biosynthesis
LNSFPRITALVLTLNEVNNLQYVLPKIPPVVDEILIVDGHSTDGTIETARQLCPKARIIYQNKKGKGDAIRCGFGEANGDIIITLDADGSMDPEEIPRFVEPLLSGYDYVKGSRFLDGGGTSDMPLHRWWANKFFVFLANMFYGTKYTDLTYGYNATWKNIFKTLPIRSDGFDMEIEMNIEIGKAKLKAKEVPSFEHQRMSGVGKLRTFRDGWKILRIIFRKKFPETNERGMLAIQNS